MLIYPVKTRLGWDENSIKIVEVAERLQDVGIQALTIHGRTRKQMYKGTANWDYIAQVKNNPRINIPIFGNGDIDSPEKANEYKEKYGVDGIMIGRAAIGNPWIFNQIKSYIKDRTFISKPNLRDTLRLEMGFCLHGNDIDDSINPIEAGLGWICKKDIDFIGKEIVDRDRANKPSKVLIGFELIEKGIPRKGYKIFNKEKELVGEVTSGSISPYSKKAIGMGYVSYGENNISEKIFIEVRSKKVEAQIVKRPFI